MIASVTDKEIQEEVMQALRWDPRVDHTHIAVSARDGIVTLGGYVDSYLEKWEAEKTAKRVHGVRAVVNEIEVKVPAGIDDEDIARAAVQALKWNIFVPARNIKVSVDHGWVTLEGDVKWRFQKDAAENAIRSLDGVKGVKNLIKIKPRTSPIELQARIEAAFKRSAELDARNIQIEVSGAKLILRGTVRSWAEREEAERIAWAAPGIEDVENDIVVKP